MKTKITRIVLTGSDNIRYECTPQPRMSNSLILTEKGYRRVIRRTPIRGAQFTTYAFKLAVVGKAAAEAEYRAQERLCALSAWRASDCIGQPPLTEEEAAEAEAIMQAAPRRIAFA